MKSPNYHLIIFVYLLIVYSLYFFLDIGTMISLGREDGLIEYLTFLFFLGTTVFFTKTYLASKNKYYLLLALVFLFGAGEEISWGQRIFTYATPPAIGEVNVQNEFNLHNIEVFNSHDFEGNRKSGVIKLLTINFLYKLFWLFFGVIIPSILLLKLKLPLIFGMELKFPPLSIGLFFIVNWVVFKILDMMYFTAHDFPRFYHFTVTEVMESGSAFIFFVISYYFFSTNKINIKK